MIINAIHDNQLVRFWANTRLKRYIDTKNPTDPFEITINREEVSKDGLSIPYPNSVVIPGYLCKVVLSK